ncbi:MAG: hypothetical protein IRY85_19635 [Micromonosporaceae bacterium]|nr:hypothetical protein [Micromonosporaceae bacterium]
MVRKAGRWFNPMTLLLAMACFALPFVSVACDTPGGYAGASPGGTTSYNGVALVIGGRPEVTDGHERPVPPGEDDRLPPQPALAAALVAIVAAGAAAIRVRSVRTRRATVAALAAAGAAALLVGQVLVVAELTVRLSDHLARMAAEGVTLDATKTARDYVQTGQGFLLCLVLLTLVIFINGIGWWRARPRPALVAPAPTVDLRAPTAGLNPPRSIGSSAPTAVDPWSSST